MKKLINSLFALLMILGFVACNNQTDNQDALDTEDIDEDVAVSDTDATEGDQVITLNAVSFEQYPDASLALSEPTADAVDAGMTQFSFDVQNYELGAQSTLPDNLQGMANSDKGQHIHFILDNDPYSAHYESTFEKEMSAGDHIVLAFLSRSFHASVKNANSFIVKKYTVGEGGETMEADLTAPHMFYSRPKGTYTGDATEKVLLDFFLVNTDLSADGNTVRVTVNDDQQFMIDKWQPYVLEGLPMGENTIKLELLDGDKNLVDSPFNPVTRTVTLEPAQEENM